MWSLTLMLAAGLAQEPTALDELNRSLGFGETSMIDPLPAPAPVPAPVPLAASVPVPVVARAALVPAVPVLPFSTLGFLGFGALGIGAWWSRNQLLARGPFEGPALRVVSRTSLGGNSGLALIEVKDHTGAWRRMVVGVGGSGPPELVADLGPTSEEAAPSEGDLLQTWFGDTSAGRDLAMTNPGAVAGPALSPTAPVVSPTAPTASSTSTTGGASPDATAAFQSQLLELLERQQALPTQPVVATEPRSPVAVAHWESFPESELGAEPMDEPEAWEEDPRSRARRVREAASGRVAPTRARNRPPAPVDLEQELEQAESRTMAPQEDEPLLARGRGARGADLSRDLEEAESARRAGARPQSEWFLLEDDEELEPSDPEEVPTITDLHRARQRRAQGESRVHATHRSREEARRRVGAPVEEQWEAEMLDPIDPADRLRGLSFQSEFEAGLDRQPRGSAPSPSAPAPAPARTVSGLEALASAHRRASGRQEAAPAAPAAAPDYSAELNRRLAKARSAEKVAPQQAVREPVAAAGGGIPAGVGRAEGPEGRRSVDEARDMIRELMSARRERGRR